MGVGGYAGNRFYHWTNAYDPFLPFSPSPCRQRPWKKYHSLAALLDYIFTGRIPGVLEGVGYALAIAGMILIQAEMTVSQRRK